MVLSEIPITTISIVSRIVVRATKSFAYWVAFHWLGRTTYSPISGESELYAVQLLVGKSEADRCAMRRLSRGVLGFVDQKLQHD